MSRTVRVFRETRPHWNSWEGSVQSFRICVVQDRPSLQDVKHCYMNLHLTSTTWFKTFQVAIRSWSIACSTGFCSADSICRTIHCYVSRSSFSSAWELTSNQLMSLGDQNGNEEVSPPVQAASRSFRWKSMCHQFSPVGTKLPSHTTH